MLSMKFRVQRISFSQDKLQNIVSKDFFNFYNLSGVLNIYPQKAFFPGLPLIYRTKKLINC